MSERETGMFDGLDGGAGGFIDSTVDGGLSAGGAVDSAVDRGAGADGAADAGVDCVAGSAVDSAADTGADGAADGAADAGVNGAGGSTVDCGVDTGAGRGMDSLEALAGWLRMVELSGTGEIFVSDQDSSAGDRSGAGAHGLLDGLARAARDVHWVPGRHGVLGMRVEPGMRGAPGTRGGLSSPGVPGSLGAAGSREDADCGFSPGGFDSLAEEVMRCSRCGLSSSRRKVVFGEGDPRSRLMFVGEAPGADEDVQGRPFVGRAGQLLTRIIAAMGLSREETYITNVLKCRPPGNRNPEPDEISGCLPYLEKQIELIQPEVICTLGLFATQTLAGVREPIGRMRGNTYDYRGIPLIPTYHPAACLRNPDSKKLVWEDIKRVMHRLGLPIHGGMRHGGGKNGK